MNYYHDSEPTQYAQHAGGSAEARSWTLPIMLAGLVMLTALVLAFVISTAVKSNDPVDRSPSVVVTTPVTTVTTVTDAPQSTAQTTAVAPTNTTRQPATTTRSPEPAPATMTNPLEPAPATMTNPLEPAPIGSSGPAE